MKNIYRLFLIGLCPWILFTACKSVAKSYDEDTSGLTVAAKGVVTNYRPLSPKAGAGDIGYDGKYILVDTTKDNFSDTSSSISSSNVEWDGLLRRDNNSYPMNVQYTVRINDAYYALSIDVNKPPAMLSFESMEFRDFDSLADKDSTFVGMSDMPLKIASFNINGKPFLVEVTQFNVSGYVKEPKASVLGLISDKKQVFYIKDAAGKVNAKFTRDSYEIYDSDMKPDDIWPAIASFCLIQDICINKNAL